MKVIVDCVGVRDGGAARLLELLLEHLCACRPAWNWLFCVQPEGARDFGPLIVPHNAEIIEVRVRGGWIGRYRWLNKHLPSLAGHRGANLLFSFANLPPVHPNIPTILFLQQMKALVPVRDTHWRETVRLSLIRFYLRVSVGAASRVVVQSEQMKALIIEQMPHMADSVVVIQSPVMVNLSEVRPELNHVLDEATRPRLAYVSLPRLHKNHINLIRAFARVREVIPKTSLLLTVPGPELRIADPVVVSIHAEASALGVIDQIVWLGLLNHSEVATVYQYADAMVFPSLQESFGMPLAESMYARLPVIASNLPFAHEILGNAGAYFDPHNWQDIASVIINTFRDTARLKSMRTSATERSEHFSPQHVADRFCILFENTVKEICNK